MQKYLFVYGTLKSDYENPYAIALRDKSALVGTGFILGKIVQISWYPGLLLTSNNDEKVFGEVYLLPEDSDELMIMLDTYEGVSNPPDPKDEYKKTEVTATMANDEKIRVMVYEYIGPIPVGINN
jgi:gamma-glutamylcyclotransferase (GGCT)/AIG2-like uncharacterized protein YtfP